MTKIIPCTFILLLFICATPHAQSLWTDSSLSTVSHYTRSGDLIPKEHRMLTLNVSVLEAFLQSIGDHKCLEIPLPDGGFDCFELKPVMTMHPILSAKYPSIRTFHGQSINHPASSLGLVWDEEDFHAMAISEKAVFYIDKIKSDQKSYYASYTKKEASTTPFHCETNELESIEQDHSLGKYRKRRRIRPSAPTGLRSNTSHAVGSELRTYRFALAFDGAVTVALGGHAAAMTRAAVLVSDMNLLLGRELCMRLELIPNNDELIFTDPDTDPYSGDGIGYWLEENRIYLTDSIGSANFDLGHVINTTSGGVAYVGVSCFDNWKGGGTSPNDIEVLAHEIGHQLGASHTFNYCGGPGGGFEPGSGNTTMSYHGLCGSNNMPGGELLQFHAYSYQQMAQYRIDYGNACGSATVTGNAPPVVTVPSGGFTIPASTPFTLKGSASDDGSSAALTFLWDQYDLGSNSTPPQNPTGNAPIFRSYPYSADSTRTFPELQKVIDGSSDIGEVLPTYSRDLTFRFMVHDNDAAGGGVDYGEIAFEVDGNSGPFEVTTPNTSGIIWSPGTSRTIEWNTANTNLAPVSCSTVNILASFDGGYTYPDTLARGAANDGSHDITVPSTPSTQVRIKVEAADNIFFDLSDENLEIVSPGAYDFLLELSPGTQNICNANTADYQINTYALGAFSSSIDLILSGLPAGISSNLPASVSATSSTVLTLGNLNTLPNGHYPMTLTATESGGGVVHTENLYLVGQGTAESVSGNAMSFDGNDYTEIPEIGDDYQFGNDKSFSVEFWMKTTSTNHLKVMVGKKDNRRSSYAGWQFNMRGGKVWFLLADGSDRLVLEAPSASNDGQWHHVVGTLNRTGGNSAKLYIDGELMDEESDFDLASISNDKIISIGADSETSYNYTGELDEIRVWRKVLSENEVRENKHLILDTCLQDLISYYQFNESTGDILDLVSYYNGTVTGATRVASSCPVGTGTASTQVEANGQVTFTNTGLTANYTTHDNASITATRIEGAPYNAGGIDASEVLFDNQYWAISRYEQTGSMNTALTFELNENISLDDESNPSNLKLYSRAFNSSADWVFLSNATSASSANNSATFPNITDYGQFALSRVSAVLPLELLHFDAIPMKKAIALSWTTAQEIEVSGYEIRRSQDHGRSWQIMGWVKSNNLLEQQQYRFIDERPSPGKRYYYQLKMWDLDGQYSLSPIKTARLRGERSLIIYPSITEGELQLQIEDERLQEITIRVHDSLGKLLLHKQYPIPSHFFQTSLDVSRFPSGVYWLSAYFNNSKIGEHLKFVKQ